MLVQGPARTCPEQMLRKSGQPRERTQRYFEHSAHAIFDDTPMGIVFGRISFFGQVPIRCKYAVIVKSTLNINN
jgi:hypothetical protein